MADVIFCGNPGVGKSTLLSTVSGTSFQSGVSFGSGLTSQLEWREPSPAFSSAYGAGWKFGDTPGLSDIELREKAAKAITQALRKAHSEKREVKLFFVLTLESGRIKPDDLYTIKTVLDTITPQDAADPEEAKRNKYTVLINKCTFLNGPKAKDAIFKLTSTFAKQTATLPYTTGSVIFVENDSKATDQDNTQLPASVETLRSAVVKANSFLIQTVDEINIANMEAQMEEMKKQQGKEMKELEEKLKNNYAETMAAMEKTNAAMQADMKRQLEESQRRSPNLFEKIGGAIAKPFVNIGGAIGGALAKPTVKIVGDIGKLFKR